jgi:hypothetical protein
MRTSLFFGSTHILCPTRDATRTTFRPLAELTPQSEVTISYCPPAPMGQIPLPSRRWRRPRRPSKQRGNIQA